MIIKVPDLTEEIDDIFKNLPKLDWQMTVSKGEGLTSLFLTYSANPHNAHDMENHGVEVFMLMDGTCYVRSEGEFFKEIDGREDSFLSAIQKIASLWPKY